MAVVSIAAVPSAAQDRAAETLGPSNAAWDTERAFAEMERLRAEVAVLKGIAAAQAALLAWNRERAGSGAGPAVLSARLCEEPGLEIWCRVLPVTFGASAAAASVEGHGKDGER